MLEEDMRAKEKRSDVDSGGREQRRCAALTRFKLYAYAELE